MEGIETTLASQKLLKAFMSVGAPTWRGLKQDEFGVFSKTVSHVSRCPDMEGIETVGRNWR